MTIELDWFESLAPVGDAVIFDVESALGVALPVDYRQFAKQHHGGAPIQTDFDLADPRKAVASIGQFLSFVPESGPSFILKARSLLADRLHPKLVPVAEGPGGDYLCLDYSSGEAPTVVYWHHERAGLPDEVTSVADSFSTFLGLLREPVDEE